MNRGRPSTFSQNIESMKTFISVILLLFCHLAVGQYPNYREQGFHYKASVSFGIGAETVAAFPPKVSLHAYLPRQRTVYAGLDAGVCSFGFSKVAGATVGVKMKMFILENSFSWTSVYQSDAPNKMWLSNNPKIGIEIKKIMFKVGPSFIVREYNGHHDILDWLQIAGQHFNVEICYIFDAK